MTPESPKAPSVAQPGTQKDSLISIAEALGISAESPTVEEILKAIMKFKATINDLTHQVICCGVAASHPDATLTKKGAYAGKWNSAQAEQVRELRADRDRLRATYLPRMRDGT